MDDLGILTLTHSSRTTDLRRCSLNYLTQRYADPNRLLNLPIFEELAPQVQNYSGAVSFFRVSMNKGGNFLFKYIGSIKKVDKIQHVLQLNDKEFLIGYENRLERWKILLPPALINRIGAIEYSVENTFEHPYFPGLHTAYKISQERVVISASSPDAILILNLKTGEVERILRMPSWLYGCNYTLDSDMDLRKHYITNDYQTTHINSAYPMQNDQKVLVSTLIQGAIGIFDLKAGDYKELIRGFVGCHGVRVNDEGTIYFADSVTGSLVFLNEDGKIIQRFRVESRWLHDVQQIKGNIYAFSIADLNELHVYNIKNECLLFRKKFLKLSPKKISKFFKFIPQWVGNSTQFMSYYPNSKI